MWEKANVGVRMTTNYILGALWLLRWQTHTLRFLLEFLITAFGCAEGPLACISGSPLAFGA